MNSFLIQLKYENPALSDAILAIIITIHITISASIFLLVLFSRNIYLLITAILFQIIIPFQWILFGHCLLTPIENTMSQKGINNGAVNHIMLRILNIINTPNSQSLVNLFLFLLPIFIIFLAVFKIYYYKLAKDLY